MQPEPLAEEELGLFELADPRAGHADFVMREKAIEEGHFESDTNSPPGPFWAGVVQTLIKGQGLTADSGSLGGILWRDGLGLSVIDGRVLFFQGEAPFRPRRNPGDLYLNPTVT